MTTTRSTCTALLLAALCCLLLPACKPAAPPEAAKPPADTIALLDGEPLSRSLLDEIARQQAGTQNPHDAPAAAGAASAASAASAPAVDRQALLEELIGIELLARKARERGLDRQAAVVAEMELQAKTILAQIIVREQIAGIEVSDADLAAAYEERVPPHLFKVAHILVKDVPTAQALLGQLQQGKAFAELARRHSTDIDNRNQGGSLGWVMMDQMPGEIALAVRHLKPGEHAPQPVQTAQGWHLVQLQGLKPLAERPSLQTASVWLHPQVVQAKVEARQQQWRREAKVQLTDAP